MRSRFIIVFAFVVLVLVTIACSKNRASAEVVVEIPAGFSGYFVLEMGVHDAPPLQRDGDEYVLSLPRDGKAQTSTILSEPRITFRNHSGGQVWGYSQRTFTTGDGISVGGKLEFFVGTQKEFEAEQNKRNKSGVPFSAEPMLAAL
jgi:hypothetical protein